MLRTMVGRRPDHRHGHARSHGGGERRPGPVPLRRPGGRSCGPPHRTMRSPTGSRRCKKRSMPRGSTSPDPAVVEHVPRALAAVRRRDPRGRRRRRARAGVAADPGRRRPSPDYPAGLSWHDELVLRDAYTRRREPLGDPHGHHGVRRRVRRRLDVRIHGGPAPSRPGAAAAHRRDAAPGPSPAAG